MTPKVIFENMDWIAFDKPSGLLSIRDRFNADIPNLAEIAQKIHGRLFVVHRLDKTASGVLCFAKNAAAHQHLSMCFERREVLKYYQVMVLGKPTQSEGTINIPIGPDPLKKGRMLASTKGKEARTDYEILDSWQGYSLLKIRIYTGRTHQIRVHLQHLGHPIVADSFYGDGKPFFLSSIKKKYKVAQNQLEERPILNRLALHACELSFKDQNEELLTIQSSLPKDMSVMVKQLNR